jgi:hypothetical protein
VDGTDACEVELTGDENGGLTGWCDCPYGQEGNFCKHCVAVGLTVLRQARSVPRQRSAAAARTRLLDIWLESRSREELLAPVREQLADDRDLRRRLELRAATAGEDTGMARERVLSLLDTRPFARHGYVEYAYGRQAAEAITALRALTSSGTSADAVGVAHGALRALGRTYGEIDDSDGLIGDVATGLAEAHLEACPTARPDPVETAEWLVSHLLDDGNNATDMDLFDYREVLGEPAVVRARELVVAAWQASPKGWAEKVLMERLLKGDGGSVDALVAVHAADLAPNGHTHLVIAMELEAAGVRPRPWGGPNAACGRPRPTGGRTTSWSPSSANGTRGPPASRARSRSAGTCCGPAPRWPPTSICVRRPGRPTPGRAPSARAPWRC